MAPRCPQDLPKIFQKSAAGPWVGGNGLDAHFGILFLAVEAGGDKKEVWTNQSFLALIF